MEEKCPWCGGELEPGTFRSGGGGNYFLPEGEKPTRMRFYTYDYIRRVNAIALPPDPYGGVFEKPEWPKAQACRNCKKIIISY